MLGLRDFNNNSEHLQADATDLELLPTLSSHCTGPKCVAWVAPVLLGRTANVDSCIEEKSRTWRMQVSLM
jgi:nitrate reductase beta subunit